jgi:phosphoketolase
MATQITLPAFMSSVASSSDLIRQLLPLHFNSTNGVDDLLFTSAADVWMMQTAQNDYPQLATNQKAWDAPLFCNCQGASVVRRI